MSGPRRGEAGSTILSYRLCAEAPKAQSIFLYNSFHSALCPAYGHTGTSPSISHSFCVTNIRNQVNEIPDFYFICTPRCTLKMHRNRSDRISSHIFLFPSEDWTEVYAKSGHREEKDNLPLRNVPMVFFYVLYQSVNIYDNSTQRNASKLFLSDGERACLVETGASFLLLLLCYLRVMRRFCEALVTKFLQPFFIPNSCFYFISLA